MTLVHERTPEHKFTPKRTPNANAENLDRKKPSCVTYQVLPSYNYTAKKSQLTFFGSAKKASFFDKAAISKKWVPSASQYKVQPKVFSLLSPSPLANRTYRQ